MIDEAAVAAIDDAVRIEMERARQPGLTLGLTDRDGTLLIRTYGFADLASRQPVTPETLFEIGSIGKTFTAVATLQLVDEGRIDLHAPVTRYLPWFAVPQPAGHAPITIAHLLSHTSGIVAGIDGTPEAAFQVWSLRDLPTRSAPGERFHYSNVGYKALGLVLEALEGRPYREIIRDRILVPLEMSATEPAITHDTRARLAVGYEYLHDDRLSHPDAPLAPATWLETETADGSIASTAADMCAFVRLLLRRGEGLLSEDAFAQMSTGNPLEDENDAYGYGLLMRNLDGRRFIGHGGGMVGYLAGMQADTDANLGAIVLQNGMGAHPMMLARTVIRIADGEPAKSAGTAAPSALDELAGVYETDEPVGADRASCRANWTGASLRRPGHRARGTGRRLLPGAQIRPSTGSPSAWSGQPTTPGSYGTAADAMCAQERRRDRCPNRPPSCRRSPGTIAHITLGRPTFGSSCAGTNRGSSLREHPTGSTPSNLWFPATADSYRVSEDPGNPEDGQLRHGRRWTGAPRVAVGLALLPSRALVRKE